MKIGIYAPYLEACGGGEKYICKMAERLNEKNDVEFLSFENLNTFKLESRLNIKMCKVKIITFQDYYSILFKFPIIGTLTKTFLISKNTKNYDLFINQQHYSIIPSYAKRSILICEVPPIKSNNFFSLLYLYFLELLCDPKLQTYNKIVTNSNYTKKWISAYYNKEAQVLYPPAERFCLLQKKNIILSVGRFFKIGHNKKQLELIEIFKQLYTENKCVTGWEYHFVGGVGSKNIDKIYLNTCIDNARGYPIYFHINASFDELKQLYGVSKIYWHATGLNENENEHPDLMEHFGITTVEAMSSGCVPVVINKGGQPEIVCNMIDGFLWNTVEELKQYSIKLMEDCFLLDNLSKAAIKKSLNFQIDQFNTNVDLIFKV